MDTDWQLMELATQCRRVRTAHTDIDEINSIAEATAPVSLLQPGSCQRADFAFGKVQAACGELAVRSVEFAAERVWPQRSRLW